MTDPVQPWQDAIVAWLPEEGREPFLALLRELLPTVPEGESAVVHLLRLAEASGNPRWLFEYLRDDPATLEGLLFVLGGSGFAARTLSLHPEYLEFLVDRRQLTQPKGLTNLQQELVNTLQPFRSVAGRWNAVRRFRRRETVRLIAADLLGLMDLKAVTAELSDLAEAILRVGLTLLPPDESFCPLVVAFGKLGARELNYSSDIDLVFFHDGDSQAAERWARKFVQALTEVTEYGRLYRVDVRLRPYGATGPLSLTLDAAFSYYESVADPSERLALLKSRAVAGDETLAHRFEQFRTAFVFGSSLDPEEFAWLLRIKERSEAAFATEGAVKHGLGGIRDVEMTVQFSQLAFANRFPALQVRDTITALTRLHQYGLLTDEETQTLLEGYRFLRRLEHMLQIAEDLPLQTLPNEEKELIRIARCLGLDDAAALQSAFQHHTQAVRQVYERVVAELAKTLGVSPLTTAMVAIASRAEVDATALKSLGFARPAEAEQRLHRLVHGETTAALPWRERVGVIRVLPTVLTALSRTPDPDTALARMESLLSALGPRRTVLESLSSNLIALRALAIVASLSEPLCQLAVRAPEQLEALLSGNRDWQPEGITTAVKERARHLLREATQSERGRRWQNAAKTLRQLKRPYGLALGFASLCRLADAKTTSKGLTRLADAIVSVALDLLPSLLNLTNFRLSVFAMGAWGSETLHFGSDLDTAFLHEGDQMLAEKAVRELRSLLSEAKEDGVAYRLDLRLRPTGQEGALSSDEAAWFGFTNADFEPWMALAWTRLRFVAGDGLAGSSVLNAVRRRLYEQTLTDDEWEQLNHLLRRILTEHQPLREVVDLKHSPGALWDIELAVAEAQLREGRYHEGLRTSSILSALNCLAEGNTQWQEVRKSYEWIRQQRLWFSWIAPDQPPRFVKGDAIERLLAWLEANEEPLSQERLVPVDEAVESWRHRWKKVTEKVAGILGEWRQLHSR